MQSSPDGRTWTPRPAGELSGWVRSAGMIGDRLAVVLDGNSGTQLATSTAGGPWTVSAPLDALAEADVSAFVNDLVVGPLGAAAVITLSPDPIAGAGGVDIAGDGGYVLHLESSDGAAQLLDASGVVLAETTSIYDSSVSRDFTYSDRGDLVVRDPATGETLAVFSTEALDRASSDVYAQPSPPTFYVAHTVDGANWSVVPLSDLLDEAPVTASITMTPTNIVVRASFAMPETNVPERQVALVGTPAG